MINLEELKNTTRINAQKTIDYIEHQRQIYTYHRPYIKWIMKQLGEKCNKCGSINEIQLHHHKYVKNLDLLNLEILCRQCHHKFHQQWRANKIKQELINLLSTLPKIKTGRKRIIKSELLA